MPYIKNSIIIICLMSLPCFALDYRDERAWFLFETPSPYCASISSVDYFDGQNWCKMSKSSSGTSWYYTLNDWNVPVGDWIRQSPVYFRVNGPSDNPYCKTYVYDNPDSHTFFKQSFYPLSLNYSQPSFNISDGRTYDVLTDVYSNSFIPPHINMPVNTSSMAGDLLSLIGQAAGITIGGLCCFFVMRSAIRQYKGIGS